MGLTTFALTHVFFAVSTKDERRSIFNLETFTDKPLLIALGLSLLTILWGAWLVLAEILPRVGYAAAAMTWGC